MALQWFLPSDIELSMANLPVCAEALRNACRNLVGRAGDLPLQALRGEVASAVLIPLVVNDDGIYLLFTRRTDHLRHHAGQISFPGGRTDPGDKSPEHTALREAWEEVGIRACDVEILGRLPEFSVSSGFVIRPILGLLQGPLQLSLDEFEVAEAFEVPLAHFVRRENYQLHRLRRMEDVRHVHAIAYRGRFIWGATAGILATFRQFFEDAFENAEN